MNIVAAVFADFEQTFWGSPAQLLTEVAGRPILLRTLSRVLRVEGLDARCLLVRPRDRDAAERAVREWNLTGDIDVLPLDHGARPRRALLATARKWNLDAWRGSPAGTTWFDEFVDPLCVARVIEHYNSRGVLCLEGHMPVLDPQIAAGMLAQNREYDDESRLVFTQAPPGLAGVVLRRELTRELLEQNVSLGLLLSYRPEMPRGDPINQPVCASIDPDVAQTPARLTGDTRRSRELLSEALAALGDDVGASELCAWLRQPGHDRAGGLPVEVEIELTTDGPLPETLLRPRGERAPKRHLTDLDAVERVAWELAAYDDRFVCLGGHGDPLAHPDFAEACRRVRSAGVLGVAVVTPLVQLSEEHLAALLTSKVDIVQVQLDADCPETYRAVHRADHYAAVLANVERIEQARRERLSPQPVVVCSLTRCAATLAEMERFYDRWIQATGWALIEGYNDFCGDLAADCLLSTTPPIREPCRRLGSRMMLLADGVAALCSQDYRGEQPIGNWASEPLSGIWGGQRLEGVRQAHVAMRLAALARCERCREWFRP